jgi:hypothetical protein
MICAPGNLTRGDTQRCQQTLCGPIQRLIRHSRMLAPRAMSQSGMRGQMERSLSQLGTAALSEPVGPNDNGSVTQTDRAALHHDLDSRWQ